MRMGIRPAPWLAGVALAALSLAPAMAHGHKTCCAQGMAHYDAATEVTFRGVVERVEPHSCSAMGRGRGQTGVHLLVETDDGEREVHLGPTAFLSEQGVAFADGDLVEITGSRVTCGGSDAVLAREVKKGDKTLTLRDTTGAPAWAGRRRR
jgi:hypothetical protein